MFLNILRIFIDSTTALIWFTYVPADHLTSKMTLGPLRTTESKLKSNQTYWDFFGVCVTKKYCQFTQKKFSSLKMSFYCENSKFNLPSEYKVNEVRNVAVATKK